jgi:hypothetical protein
VHVVCEDGKHAVWLCCTSGSPCGSLVCSSRNRGSVNASGGAKARRVERSQSHSVGLRPSNVSSCLVNLSLYMPCVPYSCLALPLYCLSNPPYPNPPHHTAHAQAQAMTA